MIKNNTQRYKIITNKEQFNFYFSMKETLFIGKTKLLKKTNTFFISHTLVISIFLFTFAK
jgi:hypothetical protein